jgi:hypothetical protein
MVYADDVSVLGENINTVKKDAETLLQAGRKVGLEVNTEKTKYTVVSSHQNAGQNHDMIASGKVQMFGNDSNKKKKKKKIHSRRS